MVNFLAIERKWQKAWEKKKIFKSEIDKKKKKYFLIEMFPYPSSSGLHMGHALNYTIGDIYARFKRMNNFNVLYPMGFDALGLPAENAAIQARAHPKPFTEKAIKNYIRQMKELGLSYDWSRMVVTCYPDYYKWNQYFFLKFYEKGLIYRKKSAVNWCPKCQTVLANEQVHSGKCWRHETTDVEIKQLEQWFIKTTKYSEELLNDIKKLHWPERIKLMQENWIGKSYGTEIDFEINNKKWPVFTTRPDTIYGVTFMVVSAQHPRLMEMVNAKQKSEVEKFLKKLKSVSEKELEEMEKEGVFTGSYGINPLTKEKIPVYAGNFVVADYGSGMVMAVPAHDQRDFEFAKKYNIPIKIVIKPKIAGYMIIEKSIPKEAVSKLKEYGEITIEKEDKDWGKFIRVKVPVEKEDMFIQFLEKNLLSEPEDGGAWYADSFGTTNVVVFPKKHFVIKNGKDYNDYIKYGLTIGIPKKQLEFELKAYTEEGTLVNSDKFSGMYSKKAIEEITKFLESRKLGKKTVNYKLRDWLVSRQRYWGTPIPMIYCENCAINDIKTKLTLDFHGDYRFNLIINGEKTIETRALDISGRKEVKMGDLVLLKHEKKGERIAEIEEVYHFKNLQDLFENGKNLIRDIFPQEKINCIEDLINRYNKTAKNYVNRINNSGIAAWKLKLLNFVKAIPVPEKDLPVLLPEKVKFGQGNPLSTNKKFTDVKCPKCKSKARRETDTMDTFFDSSWYFLRYCDNKNKKKPFDTKKVKYWMPVDQYIGGAEHACMHLIYARFFTKALRDLGLLNFDEPFTKLFNQGMLHGTDGEKMSKSRGNVVLPEEVSKKYGMDTARLFLMSQASPEKDMQWNENGIEGSLRIINKIISFFDNAKLGKSSPKVESKLNKTIKEFTDDIENFRYNLGIIKLRLLFETFEQEKEISKKDLESFLKMLHPICPHITEELWHKLKNKNFISLEKWPVADEGKINIKLEEADKIIDKTVSDIVTVLSILKEKGIDGKTVYLYVIPNELQNFNPEILSKRINKEIKIFAVNDKNKYDPQGKSAKCKPGKPAIFIE